MKDKKLIQQIQRGNKELLNTVIEKYYDEIRQGIIVGNNYYFQTDNTTFTPVMVK